MTKTDRFAGGTVPRYLAILVAAVLGLSLFPAAALAQSANDGDVCPPPDQQNNDDAFPDDEASFHEDNINCVAAYNIAQGFPDGTYKPGRSITRAQMATFIANFLDKAGVDLPEGSDDAFPDDDNSVHEGNINILADLGIIQGFADGTYRPQRDVSREQMATYIANAIEEDTEEEMDEGDDAFTDDEQSVHESNINKLANADIIQGTGGTFYSPREDVSRGQMATFIIGAANYLDAVGEWLPTAGAELALASTTTEAGGEITGVVSGDVTDVDVTGCGLNNQDLNDENADADGFQFTVNIPANQPAGECELEFTITRENGSTFTVTRTITVEGAATGAGATERPELTSATITETDTTGADAGTTIQYCFDEEVEQVFASALFLAYNANAQQYQGDDADPDTANGNCVIVFFSDADLRTQAGADALTVATVDFGAVQDAANDENPIGDAPLNGTQGGQTTLPAGITTAPDLVGVDVRNRITGTDTFEVLFTFDETVAAASQAEGAFNVILEDGTAIACFGQEAAPGDTTVEAECNLGANRTEADVSRGTVFPGAVADSNGNTNPLQAAEAEGDDGNTEIPDLVSAQFFPSSGTADDRVAYHFDEPVTLNAGNCSQFAVYDVDSNETFAAAGECTQDDADTIIVDFPDRTLEDMVGANVRDNAVRESSGAARPNEEDEVGVQNTTTTTGAGFTIAPDLIEVNVEERVSLTGTRQGIRATYTFDEDLDELIGLRFFLYEADGTRYQAVACELSDPDAPREEQTVECTDYRAVDDAGAQISPDPDPRDEDVENAVLGTVDNDQVEDPDNNGNPEGAEPVTAP